MAVKRRSGRIVAHGGAGIGVAGGLLYLSEGAFRWGLWRDAEATRWRFAATKFRFLVPVGLAPLASSPFAVRGRLPQVIKNKPYASLSRRTRRPSSDRSHPGGPLHFRRCGERNSVGKVSEKPPWPALGPQGFCIVRAAGVSPLPAPPPLCTW